MISFLTRGEVGGYGLPFTFENYTRFAGFGFFGYDLLYPQIILRSLVLGAGTALLCMLAALPLAFFIAGLPARYKNLALTLVLIPFWTNLLIRTYAWQILLAPESPITQLAAVLGFVKPGEPLYPSALAIYLGMICDYLPFLVLPLYSSVEKIDWSIAEAASDLGADGPRVFWHAILPQVTPGFGGGRRVGIHSGDGTVRDSRSARRGQDGDARQRHPAAVSAKPRLAIRIGDCVYRHGGRTGGVVGVCSICWREGRGIAVRRLSLPLWLISAFLYIFMYAPIAVVIIFSFNYGEAWRAVDGVHDRVVRETARQPR